MSAKRAELLRIGNRVGLANLFNQVQSVMKVYLDLLLLLLILHSCVLQERLIIYSSLPCLFRESSVSFILSIIQNYN